MARAHRPRVDKFDFERHIFPAELQEIAHRHEHLGQQPLAGPPKWRHLSRHKSHLQATSEAEHPLRVEKEAPTRAEKFVDYCRQRWWLKPVGFVAAKLVKPFQEGDFGPEPAVPHSRFHGRRPSTELGLVGLALSGGGIRSATFNLGVVQALADHGIFKWIDYISTVSGGGYFGSCLSSLLNHQGEARSFPFGQGPDGCELPALRQLRNNSNYLAPGGLTDLIRIPALLLRGILIHFAVLLPYIVAAVWLTYLFCGAALRGSTEAPVRFFGLTLSAALVFIVWALAYPFLQRILTRIASDRSRFLRWKLTARLATGLRDRLLKGGGFAFRSGYEQTFAVLMLGVLAVAVIELMPTALSYHHYYIYGGGRKAGGIATLVKGIRESWQYATLASLLAFMSAGSASANVGKLRGRLALIGLGLLGPLLLLGVYIFLGEWCMFGEMPKRLVGVVYWSGVISGDSWIPAHWPHVGPGWWAVTVLAAAFTVYTMRYVDMNSTSLHAFYRDRLSKAFLFRVNQNDCVEPNDTQKLSALNQAHEAPYHLINAALNLQGDDDPDLRGRMSDFFLFSKHFVGSRRTGYCLTSVMEHIHPRLDLGTAMAISGAAAAPNMGSTTSKPLVFVMALLNVRLGYWLPNPFWVAARRRALRLMAGVGPVYLLRELLGRLDETRTHINVTDGGHIENLGIYELLRRRCKYIIAIDAEADGQLTFGSLAKVMRYAWIDSGIRIEIELDEVRRREDGLSRKKCALGKIRYPDGETGHLLYIKSSITGDEAEYIREYRTRNVDFPHQTTADQFFDEAQFEAYRALGYHAGSKLFPEEDPSQASLGEYDTLMEWWFDHLQWALRPRFGKEGEFIDLQQQLSDIEQGFRDPDLAAYTYEVYPEICRRKPPAPRREQTRKIFHFCNLQLQLMENVWMALELDKPENRDHYLNRGWMNLFRRWAHAPSFRHAWAVSISTYSVGFQRFCHEALRLRSTLHWRSGAVEHLSGRDKEHLRRLGLHGLIGEADQLAGRYEIWVAEMCLDPFEEHEQGASESKGFAIGSAVLRFVQEEGGGAHLLFYRIKSMYRQMRLLEPMLKALRQELRPRYPARHQVRAVFEDSAAKAKFAYFLERCGFAVDLVEVGRPEVDALRLPPEPAAGRGERSPGVLAYLDDSAPGPRPSGGGGRVGDVGGTGGAGGGDAGAASDRPGDRAGDHR